MSAYQVGMRAERIVEGALRRAGWRILARNYRGPGYEIDLVVADPGTLIFVEIKYRKHSLEGAELSGLIGSGKRKSLYRGARAFLSRLPHGCLPDVLRFDLAFLYGPLDSSPGLQYFENFLSDGLQTLTE